MLAPLRVSEAADSLAKASTPEPFSSSRTSNWIARLGGLPPYVQHIAHDLMEKRGKTESNAIQMAVGIVKNPPRNWGADARAAAAKAAAQWEALKGKAKAKGITHPALQHSVDHAMVADELALRDAALERLVAFESAVGVNGMVGLLAEQLLQEASPFVPTLKRTASASGEVERHEVYDGGQHVGTVARRRGYGNEGDRYSAHAVNGTRVTDMSEKSRAGALDALRRHLEEAPSRVMPGPTAGKFLCAQPQSYSGQTTFTQFSSEAAARHAAGLPPAPTGPENAAKLDAVAEVLRFDLLTVEGLDIPPLRRVQEARRGDPFDLVAEAFAAGEARDFHGRWRLGGGHHARLDPRGISARSTRTGRPKSDAARRYEGGVVRQSARLRAAHAAKPQIGIKDLPGSVGSGAWDKSAARAARAIMAGKVADTEHAHRAVTAGGALGAYSAERKALHERILSNLLQGKGVHEGKAEAIFTAGGPASGKSGLVRTGDSKFERAIGKESTVKLPPDVVHADPDVIRTMLPEYQAMVAAGREDASSKTHEEASHLAKVATRLALGRQHHLLVDTVGDSPEGKFAGKIKDAQRAGHKVSVHYATTDVNTAIKRAQERAARSGRHVPTDYLRAAHRDVSLRFEQEISKLPGVHLRVVDTTMRPNKVIAERQPGDKLRIRDEKLYRQFLAKAKGR